MSKKILDKLSKNIISVIVIAALVVSTGVSFGMLKSQEPDMGSDPVYGINPDRIQMIMYGDGYKLNKEQEREYQLQQKQNKKNADKMKQELDDNNSFSFNPAQTSGALSGRYGRMSGPGTSPTKLELLTVSSNLSEEFERKNWKTGDEIGFYVVAGVFSNGKMRNLSSDNVKISLDNDKWRIKDDGTSKNKLYYKLVVGDGNCKVTINAKDPKTKKKSTKTYSYIKKKDKKEKLGMKTKVVIDLSGLGITGLKSFDSTIEYDTSDIGDVLDKISDKTNSIGVSKGNIKWIKLTDEDIDEMEENLESAFDPEMMDSEQAAGMLGIYNKETGKTAESTDDEGFAEWLGEEKAAFEEYINELREADADDKKLEAGKPFESSHWAWSYTDSDTGKSLGKEINISFELYDFGDDE